MNLTKTKKKKLINQFTINSTYNKNSKIWDKSLNP